MTLNGQRSTVVCAVSPKNQTKMVANSPLEASGSPLESRADPDAQTTVTDFLDFTEYLPSDMVRSLTMIGKLDEAYTNASLRVNDLTATWGQLPSLTPDERPAPARLRADISEQLSQAVSARVFAHAEAVRMSETVNRHYHKAQVLLTKLQTLMENYPADDQRSPTAPNSPQMTRTKLTVRATGEDGKKIRHHKVPRITVPGEVLAPYDIEYDTFTDDSDISTDEESDIPAVGSRRTPATAPRIKLITHNTPKSISRARPAPFSSAVITAAAAANAEALLHPPPENAVVGSADAPWLQLTQYELAKLRKRMKKNAAWTPSETMVARELKALGRGPEEYRNAKKEAEIEGKDFDPKVPSLVVDDESGTQQLPAGAISVDSLAAEEVPTSNRGMKLNEAKKIKREALAKMAAEEAEESARKMARAAKLFLGGPEPSEQSKNEVSPSVKARSSARPNVKRKREPEDDATSETTGQAAEEQDTPTSSARLQAKRARTETPVHPPQGYNLNQSNPPSQENLAPPRLPTPASQSETPVPLPVPQGSASRSQASPTPNPTNPNTVTTSVPTKPPGTETPVPLPRRRSVTAVLPPVRETPAREAKRETRGDAAKRTQQSGPPAAGQTAQLLAPDSTARPSPHSRGQTPRTTPGAEASRRPGSRGKAMSQEPGMGLATDRARRSSTARNTPVPETKQTNKRTKRPAPGVVSTTNSGGNSAVGARKAAPRKKTRATKREKGQVTELEIEEVDDEGKPIDPEEPRYCLCNRVSFGTMIQCDNLDNCKQEWFHLECVALTAIPARTTKWYCPDCRKVLNIGERGEVSARGVKK